MDRKIMFRIWDGENMFFPDDNSRVVLEYNKISGWNLTPNVIDKNSEYLCGESQSKKDFKLMQFIGLKDCDNVDIYENDYVEFYANYTNKPCGFQTGLVVFDNSSWVLRNENGDYSIAEETDEFYYKSKVIGNAFEKK